MKYMGVFIDAVNCLDYTASVTEKWTCNCTDRRKQKYSGKEPAPLPLRPPQIPHGMAWDQTPVSAVTDRQVTHWASTRPTYVSRGNCHGQPRNEHRWQTVLITSSSVLLRSQCISVDCSMIDEGWWVRKDLEERGYSLVEVFAWSDSGKWDLMFLTVVRRSLSLRCDVMKSQQITNLIKKNVLRAAYPEDRGSRSIRNVGKYLTACTASHPRRR